MISYMRMRRGEQAFGGATDKKPRNAYRDADTRDPFRTGARCAYEKGKGKGLHAEEEMSDP